jgi:hypothetical protein
MLQDQLTEAEEEENLASKYKFTEIFDPIPLMQGAILFRVLCAFC